MTGRALGDAIIEETVQLPPGSARRPIPPRYENVPAAMIGTPEAPVAVVYLEGAFPPAPPGTNAVVAQHHLQFRNQFERFTELQDARLSAVRERCLSVATTSVRLRAAAEENDVPLLYEVAADELRTLDGNSLRTPRPTFFLFFDASGSVLTPPLSQPHGIARLDAWRRESRRAAVHRTLTGSADQQVTVIAGPSTTGRSQLSEIIITRMPAVDGGPPLGALLLAFPAVPKPPLPMRGSPRTCVLS